MGKSCNFIFSGNCNACRGVCFCVEQSLSSVSQLSMTGGSENAGALDGECLSVNLRLCPISFFIGGFAMEVAMLKSILLWVRIVSLLRRGFLAFFIPESFFWLKRNRAD